MSEREGKPLLRRPKDTAFKQQRLPAFQPVLSPAWIVPMFLILGIVLIPIGILIIVFSSSVVEVSYDYTDDCKMIVPEDSTSGAMECFISKHPIKIEKEMKKPVYMYYKLENFYQNHRRYTQSRSDTQLAGGNPTSLSDCSPLMYAGELHGLPLSGTDEEKEMKIYNPCGLIAWSMFNDSFVLYDTDGTSIICNSTSPTEPNMGGCTKDGIAWKSDKDKKFRAPPADNKNRKYPQTYYNESSHVIPSVTDEDLMVWMRTAALPHFRKLHRIIDKDLKEGEYYVDIIQNYPVTGFGGRKILILSTMSWIGGSNMFMGIAYIVVGAVCFILAGVFGVKAIINLMKKTD